MSIEFILIFLSPVLLLVIARGLLGGFRTSQAARIKFARDEPIRAHELKKA